MGRLLREIWNFLYQYFLYDAGDDLRRGSGAAAFYAFLLTLFFVLGAALMLLGYLLGFDLDDVDRWMDGALEILVPLAMRVVGAVVLLICAVIIGAGLYQRLSSLVRPRGRARKKLDKSANDSRQSWGAMICALIVGYFSYFLTFK